MTPTKNLLRKLRRPSRDAQQTHVHFHRGPEGRPAPCFDERCDSPQLRV